MKSFASLASAIGSYIYISDKPDDYSPENPFNNMNGPIFEKVSKRFKGPNDIDPVRVQQFMSWAATNNKSYNDQTEF
jgi:hypothetical protein